MRRRTFLQASATISAASLFPGLAGAATDTGAQQGWSIGFNGVTDDLPVRSMTLEGSIPEACFGTLYRNGPALYKRNGQRYQHWFDPDGMIQAFRLGPEGISHSGRFVRSRKYLREEQAGRFLFNGAGSVFPDSVGVRNNEDTNAANINVLPFDGELLALWEAGSPYRVDPVSLETKGQRHWSDDLAGVPFSAHPHFDDRGDLWNIGAASFASRPVLVLYHIGRNGRLLKYRAQPLETMGYMHDFVLTDEYLVALNSSALMQHGESFVDRMTWTPSRPSELLFFQRSDFTLARRIEVPPSFVFHFGNAWKEAERVCFTACEYADDRLATKTMFQLAQQAPGAATPDSELVRYSVDVVSGHVEKTALGVDLEFPTFDGRRPFTAQALFGVASGRSENAGLSGSVVRVNPRTGASARFDYGKDVIVEEAQWVPGPDGGFLVHSFLNVREQRSGVAVLRAQALADGPVGVASMDRVLPLGFHGCFVPA
ncbi:MAG: carotenoid oxygenase family protein [Pseudomonadota bacterium]